MNDTSIARAQLGIAYMYGVGFLVVVMVLITRPPTLDEFAKGVLLTMMGYLGALVQQQSSYFFARQRPDVPRPGDTTVITSPQTVTTITPPPQEPKP